MQNKHTEFPVLKPKRNSAIYFFFIAIIFLLATNLYYLVEYKSLGKKVEILSSEKFQLQAEVDRIEAELDRIAQDNPIISQTLLDNQIEARAQIANLRFKLGSGNVSDKEIEIVRFEIQNLRFLVDEYNKNIDQLKKENLNLSTERDKLLKSVNSAKKQVNQLKDENTILQGKVETASSLVEIASGLKISGININSIQLRSRNREKIETRAKKTDLLRIEFDLVENDLALKGSHEVFLRVMDPSGNLLTFDTGTFKANEKTLQYTFKTSIDFSNDGKKYTIDWKPNETSNFQKGIYTIILYADGSIMGRGSISLN